MPQNFGQSLDIGTSLYDSLLQEYSANSNYVGRKFLSMDIVERVLDYNRIKRWTERHPLQRWSQRKSDDASLIRAILGGSRLLFAMLVLGKAEHLFSTLESHGLKDESLFNQKAFRKCCSSLDRREQSNLVECRKRIGAILSDNEHGLIEPGIVLPYQDVDHGKEPRGGGFGIVQKIEIAAGHLKGCNEVSKVL